MAKVKKDRTFNPKKVLAERKEIKWAKLRTKGDTVGVLKNTWSVLTFSMAFIMFFLLLDAIFALVGKAM